MESRVGVQAVPALRPVADLPERSVARELGSFARRNPMAVAGGLVGLLIVVVAVSAPLVAPSDPLKTDFRRMARAPDAHSVFGTDQVGRDTLSRVIHGSRVSLTVAFASVLLGTTVGALWGVASGYLGGRFDLVSQRITEVLQSFPDLILAMAISMAIGTGMPAVIVAIAITRIPFGNRVIRSVALTIRVLAFNLFGDGIRDTLDPRLSPAFLRMMAGGRRG